MSSDCDKPKVPWFSSNIGTVISKEDFMKNSMPPNLVSKWPALVSGISAGLWGIQNMYMNRPALAGAHKGLFYVAFTYWTLYKLEQFNGRYFLGKYKNALDYLASTEMSSKQLSAVPRKFSDADYLKPWTPFARQGGSSTKPVTELKL